MPKLRITAADRKRYEAAYEAGDRLINSPGAILKGTYDAVRDEIVLSLRCKITIRIPRSLIPELAGAPARVLKRIRVSSMSNTIDWEDLDVGDWVPGLFSSIVGPTWSAAAMGMIGGHSKSPAKAAAARRNGAKGGRPRKKPSKAA